MKNRIIVGAIAGAGAIGWGISALSYRRKIIEAVTLVDDWHEYADTQRADLVDVVVKAQALLTEQEQNDSTIFEPTLRTVIALQRALNKVTLRQALDKIEELEKS